MQYLTGSILNDTVNAIQNQRFDSHELIRMLMRRYPKEYVRELHANINADDPIQTTHAQIGRSLLDVSTIRSIGRNLSPNIRGETTECEKWEKI